MRKRVCCEKKSLQINCRVYKNFAVCWRTRKNCSFSFINLIELVSWVEIKAGSSAGTEEKGRRESELPWVDLEGEVLGSPHPQLGSK